MSAPTQQFLRVEDVTDEIRAVFGKADSIGVLAHKDADADSLGSALAFATSLRALGKVVHVLVPDPMPKLLTYLPGYETIEPAAPDHLDALFTFDCATIHRFGEKQHLVETIRPMINIDHHQGNGAFGTINLVETDAAATAHVVYRLLRALDAPIAPAVATNLYAGLLTDTGGFRHENTTVEVLRLAADLVELGADPAFVALKSYKSRRLAQVHLEGLSVGAMRGEQNGELIWSAVTAAMLEQSGADLQEAEGIIDSLQSVDTMKIAVLFKEAAPAITKISVRTRAQYNAPDICVPFGGGGHHRAAGAELPVPLAEAIPQVLDVARRLLGDG